MNSLKPPPVVAFDFDGTLTRSDTLVPFLRSLAGDRRTLQGLISAYWAWRSRNEEGRDRAKRTLVRTTTRGLRHRDVVEAGAAWADHQLLPKLRTDVVAKLLAHRAAGDRVVLVSAGLDVYLEPFAALVGVSDVICCHLETDGSGVCTGEIIGENPRGQVKVDLLRELLPPGTRLAYSYGNDPVGDGPMLAMAEHPVLLDDWTRHGGSKSVAGLSR